jgi:RHS repeat-associated protein
MPPLTELEKSGAGFSTDISPHTGLLNNAAGLARLLTTRGRAGSPLPADGRRGAIGTSRPTQKSSRSLLTSAATNRGIDGLPARTDNSVLNSGSHLQASAFYHADGNGNITALINGVQAIAAKCLYDPYGNLLSMSGPMAAANTYRFSSKEWHQNSGLVYYLCRYYDPNLQRWLNIDPVLDSGFQVSQIGMVLPINRLTEAMNDARELNFHAILGNDLVNRIDPDGNGPFDTIGKQIKGLGGAITLGGAGALCCKAGYEFNAYMNAKQAYDDASKVLDKKYGPNSWPEWADTFMDNWKADLFQQGRHAAAACIRATPNMPATGPFKP